MSTAQLERQRPGVRRRRRGRGQDEEQRGDEHPQRPRCRTPPGGSGSPTRPGRAGRRRGARRRPAPRPERRGRAQARRAPRASERTSSGSGPVRAAREHRDADAASAMTAPRPAGALLARHAEGEERGEEHQPERGHPEPLGAEEPRVPARVQEHGARHGQGRRLRPRLAVVEDQGAGVEQGQEQEERERLVLAGREQQRRHVAADPGQGGQEPRVEADRQQHRGRGDRDHQQAGGLARDRGRRSRGRAKAEV